MDMGPWQYFLTLEKDFVVTADFVKPHADNYGTFSDKFAGLLLLLGSEVDVIAKLLCKQLGGVDKLTHPEAD